MYRVLVLLLFFCVMAPLQAEESPEQAALERVFQAPRLEPDWFAAAFLAVAPLQQVQALRDELLAAYGPLVALSAGQGNFTVELEGGFLTASIGLDAAGRIVTLWFSPPFAKGGSFETLAAEVAALPGRSALLVTRDGEVLAAHEPDRALAVGSAFKLAVLAALDEAIMAGRARQQEVLWLEPGDRSLPSGFLQDWPAGSPLTLHSLAALMVSQSDNTATDALIRRLGREQVEAWLPPEARPLLTTREYFLLAGRARAAERAAWMAGDEAARRALLAGLPPDPPDLADVLGGGAPIAFGWQLSARTLCGLMDRVIGLNVLAIEPSGADPAEWEAVGFKGGSVEGGLAFVAGFLDRSGAKLCLALIWNDPGLQQGRLEQLHVQALSLLPRQSGD